MQRVQLPVCVADADLVEVYENERADARSRERLDCPRTHATEAHDHDPCRLESRTALRPTKEAVDAVKAEPIVVVRAITAGDPTLAMALET